ncbi:hypothetical protein [Arthrobacter sp.]|uniref:hypothetical protein n=1 Tax=Arthrobacter sp. TaxID=1667 RepID=UPI003A908950
MTNSKRLNTLAKRYAQIIAQLDADDANPIREYVEALNRRCAGQRVHIGRLQEASRPPAATSRFTDAVVDVLGAARTGTPYSDLAIIATAHDLTPEEHQSLGTALWAAARRNLLPNRPPEDTEHPSSTTKTSTAPQPEKSTP